MDDPTPKTGSACSASRHALPLPAVFTCDAAIELMGSFLAGDIGRARNTAFVAHIRSCERCHAKLLALELFLALRAGG